MNSPIMTRTPRKWKRRKKNLREKSLAPGHSSQREQWKEQTFHHHEARLLSPHRIIHGLFFPRPWVAQEISANLFTVLPRNVTRVSAAVIQAIGEMNVFCWTSSERSWVIILLICVIMNLYRRVRMHLSMFLKEILWDQLRREIFWSGNAVQIAFEGGLKHMF